MKFNWGTGILLAFIAFISFIMFFVITMSTNEKYEHDLVTENYYGQELQFQNDIDNEVHSQSLKQDISWKRSPKGLVIMFPENFNSKNIQGNVFFYRPSNKHLDFEIPIALSGHTLLIPQDHLVGGRWNLRVEWQVEGQSYLYKKKLIY